MNYYKCGRCNTTSTENQWNESTNEYCNGEVTPIYDATSSNWHINWYICPECETKMHMQKRHGEEYHIMKCGPPITVILDEDLFTL